MSAGPFTISCEYDPDCGKWEVLVSNAADATEAVQGFNAVVITLRDAEPGMHHRAELQPDGRYKINVGILPPILRRPS